MQGDSCDGRSENVREYLCRYQRSWFGRLGHRWIKHNGRRSGPKELVRETVEGGERYQRRRDNGRCGRLACAQQRRWWAAERRW